MSFIMSKEPCPNMTAEELRLKYADVNTEQEIADALAVANNQFWWVEDDVYDYEAGTEGYRKARKIADSWGNILDEFQNKVFDILRAEGITIPDKGYIYVLRPFMERNGYYDGGGWWIKKDYVAQNMD